MKTMQVYGIKGNGEPERLVFSNIDERTLAGTGIATAKAAGYIALRIVEIWSIYNRQPRPEFYIAI